MTDVINPATGKVLREMAASGRTATTPVADGDLLFVDSGVVVEGYWGEFNRMGVVGGLMLMLWELRD